MPAINNSEALKAISDAMRDCDYASAYAGKQDYYGKTPKVKEHLDAAWRALYDARVILQGNHK